MIGLIFDVSAFNCVLTNQNNCDLIQHKTSGDKVEVKFKLSIIAIRMVKLVVAIKGGMLYLCLLHKRFFRTYDNAIHTLVIVHISSFSTTYKIVYYSGNETRLHD